MSEELREYIERCLKGELKWMYHYDIDDHMFGVETDMCRMCRKLLDGYPVGLAIEYFEQNYPRDEAKFIERLRRG